MYDFPKPWMQRGELEKLGLSRTLLDRAYHSQGQTFAIKVDPMKKNSKINYYTPGLEAWIQKDIAIQVKAMRRR